MKKNPTDISERLLSLESSVASSRGPLNNDGNQMFERKLSVIDWFWMAVMGVGGLVGASVCGMLAVTEPAGMPVVTRTILASLACIGLFWAALSASVMRRGTINSAVHEALAAKMGFLFSLAAVAVLGVLSLSGVGGQAGSGIVMLPLGTLVLASVVLISHHIKQAELRLRSKLLEVEYRLALMAEVHAESRG